LQALGRLGRGGHLCSGPSSASRSGRRRPGRDVVAGRQPARLLPGLGRPTGSDDDDARPGRVHGALEVVLEAAVVTPGPTTVNPIGPGSDWPPGWPWRSPSPARNRPVWVATKSARSPGGSPRPWHGSARDPRRPDGRSTAPAPSRLNRRRSRRPGGLRQRAGRPSRSPSGLWGSASAGTVAPLGSVRCRPAAAAARQLGPGPDGHAEDVPPCLGPCGLGPLYVAWAPLGSSQVEAPRRPSDPGVGGE
jgi:hypothetical protein